MDKDIDIKKQREIKVGKTTIILKRQFGTQNLQQIYSDYIAMVMKNRIETMENQLTRTSSGI